MIHLEAIVAFNGSAVVLLCVVLMNAHTTIRRELPDNRLFYCMAATTILQAIIETISFFTTGKAFWGSYWFNVIINDLLFINNALFSFLWVLYVDCKLFSDPKRLAKRYTLLGIPAMLMIAASIVNLWVPIFFSVDGVTFEYARTDLYFIPMLVSGFYLLYGLILACRHQSQSRHYLFFPVLIFLLPITIAALAEFLFYGLNVLWIGAAISLTSIYINLQNQVSYTDALSGLFTRQYLKIHLQSELKKNTAQRKTAGILLDIDKFKSINDTYGHLAGDEAISAAGKILRHALPAGAAAFRFGGDEFLAIQPIKEEKDVFLTIAHIQSLTDKFNQAQAPSAYQIRFSIGFTVYEKETDSFDSFLERMDDAMYAEKQNKSKSAGV